MLLHYPSSSLLGQLTSHVIHTKLMHVGCTFSSRPIVQSATGVVVSSPHTHRFIALLILSTKLSYGDTNTKKNLFPLHLAYLLTLSLSLYLSIYLSIYLSFLPSMVVWWVLVHSSILWVCVLQREHAVSNLMY
jgi:hypothetical protein